MSFRLALKHWHIISFKVNFTLSRYRCFCFFQSRLDYFRI